MPVLIGKSNGTGALYAFCNSTCVSSYLELGLIPRDVDVIVEANEYKLLRMAGCLYCRCCGQLVSEPYMCALHELENCPIYSWYESAQCQSFVVLYVLTRGGARVPDQVLLDAHQIALMHPTVPGESNSVLLSEQDPHDDFENDEDRDGW